MSGTTDRSDRKPDPDVQSVRAAIDKHITPQQWRKIWRALVAAAAGGNLEAIRLLHQYGRHMDRK